MVVNSSRNLLFGFSCSCLNQAKIPIHSCFQTRISGSTILLLHSPSRFSLTAIQHSLNAIVPVSSPVAVEKKRVRKPGNREHHLWKSRDSKSSGQKAMNFVRIVSGLPNEKEAVYWVLDEWAAWELEFPLIAVDKALKILRNRNQWLRVIQVAKWMLSKGQGTTMTTYDTILLAFDHEARIDEARSLWNMIFAYPHTFYFQESVFSDDFIV